MGVTAWGFTLAKGDMAELVDATDLNHNKILSLFWKIKKVKALKFRETTGSGSSVWTMRTQYMKPWANSIYQGEAPV